MFVEETMGDAHQNCLQARLQSSHLQLELRGHVHMINHVAWAHMCRFPHSVAICMVD